MKIEITGHTTVATSSDLILYTAACAIQLRDHFAPAWGRIAPLVEFSSSGTEDASARQMGVFDTSDQPGALGYHDTDASGLPRGFVFAKTTVDDGEIVSVTLSHELMEMFLDPSCSLWSQTPDGNLRAFEACDAVENDTYEITVGDVKVPVSNFLLPAYFSPIRTGEPTDYLNRLNGEIAPAMTPGGYDIVLNSAGQPSQEFAMQWLGLSEAKARRKSHPLSRTGKRKGGRR